MLSFSNLLALFQLTWIEARRGLFIPFLFVFFILVQSVAWFTSSLAISEAASLQTSISAWCLRGGLVFILLIHVTSNLVREIDSGFLYVLLAHPISRFEYVIGRFFGFVTLGLIASVFSTLFVSIYYNQATLDGLFLWGGTLFLELTIVCAIGQFFALGFRRLLPALASAVLFYLLCRLLGVISFISQSSIGIDQTSTSVQILKLILELLSWFTPPLWEFARSEWLVVPAGFAAMPFANLLAWALFSISLLIAASVVDFYGHEL